MRLIVGAAQIVLLALFLSVSASAQLSVFLAGDSTMAIKTPDRRPETGWGEMLQQYFDPAKVRIEDRAQNGRSTRTFIEQGHWQKIVDDLKKGDFVFVQFGHNDGAKDRPDRYTPPEDFKKNLIRFIADVKGKKANIVLMTPVMRRRFDKDGKFVDIHGEYPDIFRTVAKEQEVPLIDMHRKSEALIVKYGVEGSKALFLQLKPGEHPNFPNGVDDNTHFRPAGAEEMAKLAVEGIREDKLKLAKMLKK